MAPSPTITSKVTRSPQDAFAVIPWQIVIFSLGMLYLVVYGLRNAGLTEYLSGVLNVLAEKGYGQQHLALAS